ncbi:endonuclease/exonuclease/phosphatase family metal-dependent hydrolase [Arthrobacter sp. SLBN-100]|uniref:endonuclease/exonuclease/phosphatase family protein n=1 Tax=Arthrobacter sp. SLBN-100 TaxID=2768450 RepID=UPI00115296D7|nr:endonuclease/exonuclease/phosphatase family protein [Arthrobacter sp. SLBN-100]TQJ66891.1 endonuclease/exonuclease/phosphatase family metal-dependent hydrolase [Arthrobacter sp. SLBN-100]
MIAACGRRGVGGEKPRKRATRTALAFRWLAAGAAAPAAATSFLRATSADWPVQAVQLLSFVPWFTVPATAAFLLALPARSRPLQLLTAALLAVHVAWLLPVTASPAAAHPGGQKVQLRAMSLNAELGGAEADDIVKLVREQGIELLALEEYTAALGDRLAAAGLLSLLPHHVSHPRDGAGGAAVYSSFQLRDAGAIRGTGFSMPVVDLDLGAGNGAALRVVAVHCLAPVGDGLVRWRSDLAALARTGTGSGPLLLAGDFNATLDHHEFRALLAGTGEGRKLVDVAASLGNRLIPTWPMGGYHLPGITLDHLVTSQDVRGADYSVHRVPGTDHAAVLATLAIPAG